MFNREDFEQNARFRIHNKTSKLICIDYRGVIITLSKMGAITVQSEINSDFLKSIKENEDWLLTLVAIAELAARDARKGYDERISRRAINRVYDAVFYAISPKQPNPKKNDDDRIEL